MFAKDLEKEMWSRVVSSTKSDVIEMESGVCSDNQNAVPPGLICTCKKTEMLPPGKLVHLIRTRTKGNSKKDHTKESSKARTKKREYMLKVVDDATEFSDIKICHNMVNDHYHQLYVP